jgi:hypothetical protein
MKIFIVACLVSIPGLSSFAQSESPNLPIDPLTHLITYTELVKVDGSLSKEKLFSKAGDWLDAAFRYSPGAIQSDDSNAGKIVARESMMINDVSYHYTIVIYIKDGRYKYVFTNFYAAPQLSVFQGNSQITDYGHCEQMINPTKEEYKHMLRAAIQIGSYQKGLNGILSQMDKNIRAQISSLKSSLESLSPDTASGDW